MPLNDIPEPFESSLEIYLQSAMQFPIYPARIPQRSTNVYPRMTYLVVSGDSDLILSGPSGMARRTVQFTIMAKSDLDACTIREQLRYSLQGYNGNMGSMYVYNSVLSELPADYDQPVNSSDAGTFLKRVEYRITYIEYVPKP